MPSNQGRLKVEVSGIGVDAGRRVDCERNARLQRWAELRIVYFGNEAVHTRLRIAIDVAERNGNLAGDIMFPEVAGPRIRRPGRDDQLIRSVIRSDVRRRN